MPHARLLGWSVTCFLSLVPAPWKALPPPDLLAALHRIEQRGAIETAHRVLQMAGQI